MDCWGCDSVTGMAVVKVEAIMKLVNVVRVVTYLTIGTFSCSRSDHR